MNQIAALHLKRAAGIVAVFFFVALNGCSNPTPMPADFVGRWVGEMMGGAVSRPAGTLYRFTFRADGTCDYEGIIRQDSGTSPILAFNGSGRWVLDGRQGHFWIGVIYQDSGAERSITLSLERERGQWFLVNMWTDPDSDLEVVYHKVP